MHELPRMTMKTFDDAQTLRRAFIGGKLKTLPNMPQNKRTWQRKKEAWSGNVVVHLGERYRDGYTWKNIRFYDDIKIYETTLENGEQMLKYSYRFYYQKTTATLLAFLLEGDHFPGAFDAEVLKPYRADKRSHPNEDNQANEEYYRPSSSLSMNVPLESRLKRHLGSEDVPTKRRKVLTSQGRTSDWEPNTSPGYNYSSVNHGSSGLKPLKYKPFSGQPPSLSSTTGESQVFRCSSDGDNYDNSQPEHTATSQCVNHVRLDQLDESTLERIIVFRRDAEVLAVDLGICAHALLSIGFNRGLGNLVNHVNLPSLSSIPADRSSNAATNHHHRRETTKAMEETNSHHADCSTSFSTNVPGPRDCFSDRGATNYTVNDLHKAYVDHDRLGQAVHHTASELNGQDFDPSLPAHSEVTTQTPNKGVTSISTDGSDPYQQSPATALTFSQRLRPAKGFAPQGIENAAGQVTPKVNPHTSYYAHLDYQYLHWSPSAADAFSGAFTASSPFDANLSGFDQPTPYLEYSLSQSVDHGTSVNHYTSNVNSFSMVPQHEQPSPPNLECLQPLKVASSSFDTVQSEFDKQIPYCQPQSVDHGTSVNHCTSYDNSFIMSPKHGQPLEHSQLLKFASSSFDAIQSEFEHIEYFYTIS